MDPMVVVSEPHQLVALANAHNYPVPASTVRVLSTDPQQLGKVLQMLPVNAAADMTIYGNQLIVAALFHGRTLSSNSPAVERPFTVVAHIWDMNTWQCTRLVSPR